MNTRLSWWVGLIGFLIVLAIPIVIGIRLQAQPEPTRFEREQAAWLAQVTARAWQESAKHPAVIEDLRKRQAAETAAKALRDYRSPRSELEKRVDTLELKVRYLED